jgi:hypothetical protein
VAHVFANWKNEVWILPQDAIDFVAYFDRKRYDLLKPFSFTMHAYYHTEYLGLTA